MSSVSSQPLAATTRLSLSISGFAYSAHFVHMDSYAVWLLCLASHT